MDNPLVQVDPGLFIWTIVTFLVLVTVLARFAWGPLLKALELRRDTISKSLEDARQAQKELERVEAECVEVLRHARSEAESIVSTSRSDANALREELREKARAEADAVLVEARRQIEIEKARALREIRAEVAGLSLAIASRLLSRNISGEDNERLVREALAHLEVSNR